MQLGMTVSRIRRGVRGSRSLAALAWALALTAAPSGAYAKTILVVAAHPDDEVIMAAGRIAAARAAGDIVKVVLVTNGDIDGVASGLTRQGEAVQSALTLGLVESDVIFLGYPDGSSRRIYDATSGTQVFTSAAGRTATYGTRGLGGMDYHRYLFGVAGPYNRNTMLGDFRALLANFRPDEVYTHHGFDAHGDHEAVAHFLTEALLALKRSGDDLQTKVFGSIVWMYAQAQGVAIGQYGNWPQLSASGWTPLVPILPWSTGCVAGDCLDLTSLEWNRAQRFVQPPSMQTTSQASNLKAAALPFAGDWFISWVRRDEFFWLNDFGTNVAATAQVSASSQDVAGGHGAARVIDGILGSIPDYPDSGKEWVTLGQLAGAWIQLDWAAPVRVAQVNLYDRMDASENLVAGTLTFSDGTSVAVGALPRNGRMSPVTFPPRTVTWVRFTVDQAQGSATGLTELQVLGKLAASATNMAPAILQGPVAASESIPASQSTTLSVVANDLDGDPLQYQWVSEGGFIQGNGASAVFTPPAVTASTYVAITVTVLDGRGGAASNSTFVQVTPAPTDSFSVSPSTVFGGNGAQGTVLLGTVAPAGGVVIPLSSSNTAVATVPASVTVAGGSTTATFPIGTSGVVTATTATISATFPGGTRPASLAVVPVSLVSDHPEPCERPRRRLGPGHRDAPRAGRTFRRDRPAQVERLRHGLGAGKRDGARQLHVRDVPDHGRGRCRRQHGRHLGDLRDHGQRRALRGAAGPRNPGAQSQFGDLGNEFARHRAAQRPRRRCGSRGIPRERQPCGRDRACHGHRSRGFCLRHVHGRHERCGSGHDGRHLRDLRWRDLERLPSSRPARVWSASRQSHREPRADWRDLVGLLR